MRRAGVAFASFSMSAHAEDTADWKRIQDWRTAEKPSGHAQLFNSRSGTLSNSLALFVMRGASRLTA